MEIPYIFTPRKDTGLVNSKIAIWLFLASEVMLFGGFFSSYIYLRLGADYPWPERALPVGPGLVNTFVLIFSSVTVVFAWASLKLRQWRRFQIFMGITIACAAIFMCLKGLEYSVKWHHQAVRLSDYTIIEGHLAKSEELKDASGHAVEADVVNFETEKMTVNTLRFYAPWISEMLRQANEKQSKIKLAADVKFESKTFPAGTELSLELLKEIKALNIAAKANNAKVRTETLRGLWATAKAEHPDKRGWQLAPDINIDPSTIADRLKSEASSVVFNVEPKSQFWFKHRDIREGATQSKLRDDTVLDGKLLDSSVEFHNVDAVDFRHVVMNAKKKGIDPEVAIENTWIIKHSHEVKEAWEWNKEQNKKLEERLLTEYKVNPKSGLPNRVPTETERYRIGWKDFAARSEGVDKGKQAFNLAEEFKGPDYEARHAFDKTKGEHHETFPELQIPRELVFLSGKFTPAWNTYYAIYFTMTFLHGLHVIGGAIVLGYYLFFGKKMYLSNPEWLANRVEVGGLFWHFVDLVWIFLFPILYLM